jgi:hypothetical protein
VSSIGTDHASTSSNRDDGSIESMMKQLGLREEDLDNTVFEDEAPPPPEATCWLAIARVFMEGDI